MGAAARGLNLTAHPWNHLVVRLWASTSPTNDDVSGCPFRIRADHSCPQRGQLYHAMTHVLSAAGSTGRSQTGHDIIAVVRSALDMATPRATIMPCATAGQNGPALASRNDHMRNYQRGARKLLTVRRAV